MSLSRWMLPYLPPPVISATLPRRQSGWNGDTLELDTISRYFVCCNNQYFSSLITSRTCNTARAPRAQRGPSRPPYGFSLSLRAPFPAALFSPSIFTFAASPPSNAISTGRTSSTELAHIFLVPPLSSRPLCAVLY